LPPVKGPITALTLCALLAIVGCGGESSDDGSGNASETTAAAESSGDASSRAKPQVTVPEGDPPKQLTENELIEGTGAEAKSGDEVTVQYVGVGYESGEEFDASWDRDEPFTFQLGASQVIPGWEQGIEGMKVGGQRELVIPPELAYGEAGSPPAIGPSETLIFVVDLLEVG
jgi:peptidylprolyl isomerase